MRAGELFHETNVDKTDRIEFPEREKPRTPEQAHFFCSDQPNNEDMGIFAEPTVAATGAAKKYWTTGVGANFGGVCGNANCDSQKQPDQNVSVCLGKVAGNPYAMDPKCPGCRASFNPTLLWFYSCHVVLRKRDATTSAFDAVGSEVRSVTLDCMKEYGPTDCEYFNVS